MGGGDRVPLPYPSGWFCLALSREVPAGAVVNRRSMGCDVCPLPHPGRRPARRGCLLPPLGRPPRRRGIVDGEHLVCRSTASPSMSRAPASSSQEEPRPGATLGFADYQHQPIVHNVSLREVVPPVEEGPLLRISFSAAIRLSVRLATITVEQGEVLSGPGLASGEVTLHRVGMTLGVLRTATPVGPWRTHLRVIVMTEAASRADSPRLRKAASESVSAVAVRATPPLPLGGGRAPSATTAVGCVSSTNPDTWPTGRRYQDGPKRAAPAHPNPSPGRRTRPCAGRSPSLPVRSGGSGKRNDANVVTASRADRTGTLSVGPSGYPPLRSASC